MSTTPYSGLEPSEVWRHFEALNAIPRCSGNEHAALEYARGVAEAACAQWLTDDSGNGIARVAGNGDGPVVAIQAHLDMVCESAPGVEYDFARQPIVPRRDGEKIYGSATTLGADNGIGVAAALALLSDRPPNHGPLELVFTVEEETGLRGALGLDASLLNAQMLVNLDSEDDRALTIGCAGGAEVLLRLPFRREAAPTGLHGLELRVAGLSGGHSGMQIHERHANAIQVALTVLERLGRAGVDVRIESLNGGSAHNAIPREAAARLIVSGDTGAAMAQLGSELRSEWADSEPGLTLELVEPTTQGEVMPDDTATAMLRLLRLLPHGVIAMSDRFEGTVETSANLAVVQTEENAVTILTSIRSLDEDALRALEERVRALGEDAGANSKVSSQYPGWIPRERSPLTDMSVTAYRQVHGVVPTLTVVHGGLECGVIVAKKPALDAVSLGPLITGAHTPYEHVYAPTVVGTWRILLALLANIASTAT